MAQKREAGDIDEVDRSRKEPRITEELKEDFSEDEFR